ncbi:MAG: hypothetical protein AB8B80_12115 [Marinicellaceae bacterium]
MKLIILFILTVILNVSLLNKQNISFDQDVSIKENAELILQVFSNNKKVKKAVSLPSFDKLKQKLMVHLKNYKNSLIRLLVKSHIISINQTNSNQNISSKDDNSQMKTDQKI